MARACFRVLSLIAALLLFLALMVSLGTRSVFAAQQQPPGPDRYAVVTQDYIAYTWWLIDWESNEIVCEIQVDHDGLPDGDEVFSACGQDLYDAWTATQSCPQSESDPMTCDGYYLQFVSSQPAQRDVGVKLPPPVAWVTLDGCTPYRSTFRCDVLPTLVLTGEEPLSGEHITGLAGQVDGKPFTCDPVCQVDLAPTGEDGIDLEFWAYSSYGDSSEAFQARVRVLPSDDSANHFWYADVLSTQWRGVQLAGCSQVWDVFPPVGGVPDWLLTPQRPDDLATSVPYEYLAAHLIAQGVADASACSDGGLLPDGSASACGLEAARQAVNDWQNRFDTLIFATAQTTGVPAQLLKNIFARESQFWPGVAIGHPEAGLGQMTENGADTTLLWNQPFYEQFCPSLLDTAVCGKGYNYIGEDQRETLRAALVNNVDAFCPDCPLGIDLGRAENSVAVFAETLLANCEQTDMVLNLNYGNISDGSVTYDDLWRYTLVNYNAGPGCLGLAVDETSSLSEPLDWASVSSHFTPVCQGALDYVSAVSGLSP